MAQRSSDPVSGLPAVPGTGRQGPSRPAARVYATADDITFDRNDLPERDRHDAVLMVDPAHYDLEYELDDNAFMDGGQQVDRDEARRQWTELRDTYEALGFDVHVVDGVEGLPDMVFCANQSFPYDDGRVMMSNMGNPEREPEVPHIADWYRRNDFDVHRMDETHRFEGNGDAILHPGRDLVWGGTGSRTSPGAYDELSAAFDVPVVTVDPQDPWYHLDTCFSALDEGTALIYEDAFDADDRAKFDRLFDRTIPIPERESTEGFAGNAHSPDGEHVIIHEGNDVTVERLEDAGYTVREIDTSEYLKAGGSVFCMKMMVPSPR